MNVISVFRVNGSFPGMEGMRKYFDFADASKLCIILFYQHDLVLTIELNLK